MVMAVANVWLLGTLRNQRNDQTNFIAEEGWSLSQGGTGRLMRSNSKLARGLGLSNIASFHHRQTSPGTPQRSRCSKKPRGSTSTARTVPKTSTCA
jgi:hypothetical protein